MTKHIELKTVNQGTALATSTLALPPLVIEGLEEFKGSFDRLCLHAGTAAIDAMLAADAEQLCGERYQRHAERQSPAYHFKRIGLEAGPLSQWLFSALAEENLPVICVETRHMRAVLKAQVNKTDRN